MDSAHVVITGAGSGIGRAVALACSQNGAAVTAIDIDEQSVQATAAECDGLAVRCDVTSSSEVVRALDLAAKANGPPTGLVCAAGILIRSDVCEANFIQTGRQLFETNYWGAVNCMRGVGPTMQEAQHGSIVAISSIGAAQVVAGYAGYCASKAALEATTKVLSLEMAPHNVRVNAVAPGSTATAIKKGLPSRVTSESLEIPLGRIASRSEIAGVVVFLLDERSSYMTGQVLTVDGGLSVGRTSPATGS